MPGNGTATVTRAVTIPSGHEQGAGVQLRVTVELDSEIPRSSNVALAWTYAGASSTSRAADRAELIAAALAAASAV